MSADPFDAQVMGLVKEINPSGAYLMGFNEYAGKLFIASEDNVESALSKVRDLRSRARTDLQRKVLSGMEAALLFDEPQPVLDDIVGTIFTLLAKEGVKDEHMLSLLGYAAKDIDACRARFRGREIPVPVKALTLYRLDGVLEILDTVKGQTKSQEVRDAADILKAKASDYVRLFELDGWGKGEFGNVERIFTEKGFDLGRREFYPIALSKAFDYSATPEQLEERAVGWIDEELPRFKRVTEKLARKLSCRPTPEEVEAKINERDSVDPRALVGVTLGIRRVVQKLVNEELSGINPRYRTKVIETPPYLTGIIPTGAAQFFDTFTKKPFQYFFETTDPKRDPDRSVVGLLGLLVHEEYGHCVHHSNSAMQFVGDLPPIQLLGSLPTGGPITEGLSFNREIEFLEVSKGLESKKRLTRTEKDYVRLLEKHGGLKAFNLELEFTIMRMRIMRFLRVVGDVRINTGKQGLLEFIGWANERTGIPKASMYFQLFPAHEGIFPGYATSYAVCGQEIRAIEKRIRDPKKRVKFSTYLCSIGFPPMSIYMRMLKEYAAKLK